MMALHHFNFYVKTTIYQSYFRYLQVRSFASTFFPGYPSSPFKDLMYLVLNVNPFNKGAISKIYAFILDSCPHTWDKKSRQHGRERLE